jgi:SAM-dependent methyltransferase
MPISIPDRVRAGAFRLRRVATNALIDLKYGSPLAIDRHSAVGAFGSTNSDYAALREMFEGRIHPDDVLVDVGCSTGRVINSWLHEGHTNRIVGIEVNADVAERTRTRLGKFGNVEIVTGDAVEHLPEDGTVFYVYNPFGLDMMAAFARRAGMLPDDGRRLLVMYYNCKHLEVFEDGDRWEIETVELEAPPYAPLSPVAVIRRR